MSKLMPCLAALLATTAAQAGPISAISASGTGVFTNSPSLIIDGIFPQRNTPYNTSPNVYSDFTTPAFTIDFGRLYTVTSLTVDVDNNDNYQVRYSVDGVNFTNLFLFLASDGPVAPSPGGMDILTTDSSFPTNPGNLTTPAYVGRTFLSVQARYLQIFGTAGDSRFAVGELQAFGEPVPEPATLAVFGGIALAGAFGYRRRKATASV